MLILTYLVGLLHYLTAVVPLLVNVAFVTLLERNILAGSQVRVGPVNVGLWGLLQPFADVVNLFAKQLTQLSYSINRLYVVSPLFALWLALALLSTLPLLNGQSSWTYSLLIILVVLSINVYPLLLSGWASNSTYAHLGSLRGVAQTISYELSLALIIFSLFVLTPSLCLIKIEPSLVSSKLWLSPLLVMWVISALAELNRTPFDFSEGESELVSGFNVEYGATNFTLIFMAEYLMILILAAITSTLFLNYGYSTLLSSIACILIASLIVWSRATFPRYRYDLLILLAWNTFLPWSLFICELICSIIFLVCQ